VGLNFAIKMSVIVGFNITKSTKIGYLLLFEGTSVNYVLFSYYICKIESLMINPTIVTCLLLYIREDRITVSKKSVDFTDFWTPIRCVQCLELTRYAHWSSQCISIVTCSTYLVSIPESVLYVKNIYMH